VAEPDHPEFGVSDLERKVAQVRAFIDAQGGQFSKVAYSRVDGCDLLTWMGKGGAFQHHEENKVPCDCQSAALEDWSISTDPRAELGVAKHPGLPLRDVLQTGAGKLEEDKGKMGEKKCFSLMYLEQVVIGQGVVQELLPFSCRDLSLVELEAGVQQLHETNIVQHETDNYPSPQGEQ
jgi:hypothetical protein